MKKTTRKILSVMLTFMLVFVLAVPAGAATIEWEGLDGSYNVAIVTKTSDWYYVYKPIDDATIARHNRGAESMVTWPVGNTASYAVVINVVGYGLKIDQALEAEGLTRYVDGDPLEEDEGYYVIPAGVLTGTYSFGYEITVYDISWRVDINAPRPGTGLTSRAFGDQSGSTSAVPSHITAAKLIPMP